MSDQFFLRLGSAPQAFVLGDTYTRSLAILNRKRLVRIQRASQCSGMSLELATTHSGRGTALSPDPKSAASSA